MVSENRKRKMGVLGPFRVAVDNTIGVLSERSEAMQVECLCCPSKVLSPKVLSILPKVSAIFPCRICMLGKACLTMPTELG